MSKKLRPKAKQAKMLIDALAGDELEIALVVLTRLYQAQDVYGTWRINGDDKRDYNQEGFEEMVDCSLYMAAQSVRLGRGTDGEE